MGRKISAAKFITTLVVFALTSGNANSEILKLNNIGRDSAVVFVHGYMGSADSSFISEETQESLYLSMMNDSTRSDTDRRLSDFDYYIVDYPADFCTNFTLTEIANRVEFDIRNAGIFKNYRYVVFIAHSFGGLVTKRVLVNLNSNELSRVSGFILLGVPSEGALLADIASFVGAFDDDCTIIRDLRELSYNSILQDSQLRWNKIMQSGRAGVRPSMHCAYEKKKTDIPYAPDAVIVPQERTDTACDSLNAANADHFEIASPKFQSTEYNWLRSAVINSIENSAFFRNQPEIGLGEIWPVVIAETWFDFDGKSDFPVRIIGSRSTTGEWATARQDFYSVPYCEDPDINSPKPSAEAQGRITRVGRTAFALEALLLVEGVAPDHRCMRMPSSANYFHAKSNAEVTFTLEGNIRIRELPGNIQIDVESLPNPQVRLTNRSGEQIPPSLKVSETQPGSGEYSGSMSFVEISPGDYLLQIRSTAKFSVSAAESAPVAKDTKAGKLSVEYY